MKQFLSLWVLLQIARCQAQYYAARSGSNQKCEETGNKMTPDVTLEQCYKKACDNNAKFFSFTDSGGYDRCFYSTTCDNPKTGTDWNWNIYEVTDCSGAKDPLTCNVGTDSKYSQCGPLTDNKNVQPSATCPKDSTKCYTYQVVLRPDSGCQATTAGGACVTATSNCETSKKSYEDKDKYESVECSECDGSNCNTVTAPAATGGGGGGGGGGADTTSSARANSQGVLAAIASFAAVATM